MSHGEYAEVCTKIVGTLGHGRALNWGIRLKQQPSRSRERVTCNYYKNRNSSV